MQTISKKSFQILVLSSVFNIFLFLGVCQTTVNTEASALKLETHLNVPVKALDTLVPPATTVSLLK